MDEIVRYIILPSDKVYYTLAIFTLLCLILAGIVIYMLMWVYFHGSDTVYEHDDITGDFNL